MNKKFFILVVFLIGYLSAFGQQEIKVVSYKLNTTDISVRTNRRDDPTGKPCALIKVLFPKRDARFLGDIVGNVSYKTNEYWVYMPQFSSQMEVRLDGFKPLVVKFNELETGILESNQSTYELCLLAKEKDAPQMYDDGMVALAHKDIVKAFDYLTKAANMGYAPALYVLGNESVVPFDENYESDPNDGDAYQEAFRYYKEGAEKGSPDAQYALAKMLMDFKEGKEFEKKYGDPWTSNIVKIEVEGKMLDDNYIWTLLEKAANAGNADAQWYMITKYDWCRQAANNGIAIAQFGMGLRNDSELSNEEYWMLESVDINSSENFEKAAEWYQKAAENGLDAAQWRLGELYARGLGVEQNINKAIELRSKAAEQGNVMFQFMMVIMYATGGFADYSTYMYPDGYVYNVEIPQDAEKADKWLRQLNHKQLNKTEKDRLEGNGLFSFTLNQLSVEFIKHSKYDKAIYWYQRETEMGYRDAFCKLGEMYFDGKGISKDYQKAREMFEKAILDDEHFGDGYSGYLRDRAKAYLGVIYRDGLGVESNQIKAKTFLEDSADKNDAKGMYELAILFETEGNSEDASKLFNELKNGWGQNDIDDYYKNKAKEHQSN